MIHLSDEELFEYLESRLDDLWEGFYEANNDSARLVEALEFIHKTNTIIRLRQISLKKDE